MIKGNLRQPEGCTQEKPQYNHETRTQSAIFPQTVTVYQQKKEGGKVNNFIFVKSFRKSSIFKQPYRLKDFRDNTQEQYIQYICIVYHIYCSFYGYSQNAIDYGSSLIDLLFSFCSMCHLLKDTAHLIFKIRK